MSDGGEGLLDVFGGGNRTTVVTGPLGAPVEAAWRIDRRTAVIEMARASGLALAGGADGNDPLAATTRGTGELIAKAIEQGARTVLVGLGGSATTDGGLGAIEALGSPARLARRRPPGGVRRAHPVRRRGRRVRPAEGRHAGPGPAARAPACEQLAERYRDRVRRRRPRRRRHWRRRRAGRRACWPSAPGLLPGFDLVAEHVDLDERIAAADVVVTGEGYLDAQSLDGKVVGGVCDLAAAADVPVVVIVGDADPDAAATRLDVRPCRSWCRWSSGSASSGAFTEPRWCIEQAARAGAGDAALTQPAVVVVAPPAGAGAWTLGAAEPCRSSSDSPAVSLPSITSTVAVPMLPPSTGIGDGIGCTVEAAHGRGRPTGRQPGSPATPSVVVRPRLSSSGSSFESLVASSVTV